MKTLNTIQKITKVISVIIKILYVLLIIGASCTLFSALVFMCFPEIIEIGVDYQIEGLEDITASQIMAVMFSATIIIVGQAIAFGFLNKYFKKELETGTPFNHEDASYLFKVAIIYLVVPIGCMLVASIIVTMAGVSDSVTFEVEILTGLLMILLSYVFHYGADLAENQKEEKENDIEEII